MSDYAGKVVLEMVEFLQLSNTRSRSLVESSLTNGDRTLRSHLLHQAYLQLTQYPVIRVDEAKVSHNTPLVCDRTSKHRNLTRFRS